MPFGRVSSKLPPNHPSYVPILSVTDALQHYVASVSSSANPAAISLPGSTMDLDGKRFSIYFAGRATIYTGASPGNLQLAICQGNPAVNTLTALAFALPANQSGLICPFWLRVEMLYDAKNQSLSGMQYYNIYSSAAAFLRSFGPTSEFMSIAPSALDFTAGFVFSVAPSAGTTIETTEFVL